MSTGLIALLDDVAAIAKVAATSVDDIAAQSMKAGTKTAGVIIDDAAVSPRYVVGFAANRELPIVLRIARGSLRNKLLFLLPAALLLSVAAPWLITPLLMFGAAYLCYEGAEKIFEVLFPHEAHHHEEKVGVINEDPQVMENKRVNGAIRTDFILSAEIMAITLAAVPKATFWTQAGVLAVVGVGVTVLVYGAVGLIVKADDLGVTLGQNKSPSIWGGASRSLGIALVKGMPHFLKLLAGVGTVAMLWVGGGIFVHGLEEFGFHPLAEAIHHLQQMAAGSVSVVPGLTGWFTGALATGLVGGLLGGALIPLVHFVIAPAWQHIRGYGSGTSGHA